MQTKVETSREEVFRHILEMLGILIQGTDEQPIEPATPLGDTGLDSICIAYFIGELQQFYGLGDALYRRLVAANRPILSIRVSELVDFISGDLQGTATSLRGAV